LKIHSGLKVTEVTAVCAAVQLCLAKVVPAGCKVNAPNVIKFVSQLRASMTLQRTLGKGILASANFWGENLEWDRTFCMLLLTDNGLPRLTGT